MSFHKSFVTAGTDTSDATALQHHIKTGKTAYIASGEVTGTGYFPAMMEFDGTTGRYSLSSTVSGNKFTLRVGFNLAPRAAAQRLLWISGSTVRASVTLLSSADGTSPNRIRLFTQNSSAATCCLLTTSGQYADAAWHYAAIAYDGDAGTAVLVIDGASDIDAGHGAHLITTGALEVGSMAFSVASSNTPDNHTDGLIGQFGYRDAYLTNWSDFMHPDGSPKNIESTLSTVWGGDPLFWHESGKMDENKGSAGAMTKNGGIILAPASAWS